jgi:hypothetical protein
VAFLQNLLNLLQEIAYLLKSPVDTRKSDISDLVQIAKELHRQLSDVASFNLGIKLSKEAVFDLRNNSFQLRVADGPFAAGNFQTSLQFPAVKRLARSIPFDNF